MNIQNIRLIGIFVGVAVLLLIPYVGMKVTGDLKWSAFDFVAAGVLLLGTGLACELVLRKVTKLQHRLAICAGILLIVAVVYVEISVGLFGTPLAGS